MLSIAMFTECYHPMRNGVVVSVDSFSRVLTELGYAVTIFTAHHPDQERADADNVYRFASIMPPSSARYPMAIPIAAGEARTMLQEHHFDVIHSNSPMLMGHVATAYQRRRSIPLVFTYHTMIEEYTHYIPLPQKWLRRRAVALSRRYANHADHIITPTRHVAEHLRQIKVTQPITVIPTGIDVDLIDATPADPTFRARQDIPEGVPLLACAGRLAQEKNLPRLLGMLREVLRHEPETHLLLMGGGPLEDELPRMAQDYGVGHRLRITGYVDRTQVMQGFRAADLCVFASLTETQGLVLGEAMACGLAVAAVNAATTREAVPDGECGFLVPDADAPLAEAVLTLLHDNALRANMARSARARAEMLSAHRCTERLLRVYRSACAR